MWIVGVEDIRPRFRPRFDWVPAGAEQQELVGVVVWSTEYRHRHKLPPFRTSRFGKDELDMFMQFRKDCKDVGYVIIEGPPDEGPDEQGAAS